jgi:hypothetical protein
MILRRSSRMNGDSMNILSIFILFLLVVLFIFPTHSNFDEPFPRRLRLPDFPRARQIHASHADD